MSASESYNFLYKEIQKDKIKIITKDTTAVFTNSYIFNKTWRFGLQVDRNPRTFNVMPQSKKHKTDKKFIVKEFKLRVKNDLEKIQLQFNVRDRVKHNSDLSSKNLLLPYDDKAYCDFDGNKDKPRIFVIYPKMVCTLMQFTKVNKSYPYGDYAGSVLYVAGQLATGLDQMHKMGIIHGNITPNTIHINRKGFLKFSDFGADIENVDPYKTEIDWTIYKDPQWMKSGANTYSGDRFSIGKILLGFIDFDVAMDEIFEDKHAVYTKLDNLGIGKIGDGHIYLIYKVDGEINIYSENHVDSLLYTKTGITSICKWIIQSVSSNEEKRPELTELIQSTKLNGDRYTDTLAFKQLLETQFDLSKFGGNERNHGDEHKEEEKQNLDAIKYTNDRKRRNENEDNKTKDNDNMNSKLYVPQKKRRKLDIFNAFR